MKRKSNEGIKVALNKISDDLKINLKAMKCLAFDSINDESLKVYMFFQEKEPYTKVIEKMEAQEDALLAGNEHPVLMYEGPRDIAAPFVAGEIYSSVRVNAHLFPLKLIRPDGDAMMIEALDLLEEWKNSHFQGQSEIIEKNVHSIRLSHQNAFISFTDEKIRNHFQEFMTRCLSYYEATTDSMPTVVARSQGLTLRTKRNLMKITPDVMKFCETVSTMTPQMLEWCKMISSGKYALVELEDDSAIDDATKLFNNVKVSTNEAMDTSEKFLANLPKPISPIKSAK
jgi:hypothetical protein